MSSKKPLVLNNLGDVQQIQAGDFVDVTAGGTGATTAAAARTNLGLAIGTNVQAWTAATDAIAALNTNGAIYRTGAGAYAIRVLAAPAAGITITNPDGVAGAPTFALANDLAALEALAGTGFAVRTAADTWAQRSLATASNARLTVTNPDGTAGNPTFDLAQLTNAGGGTLQKFTQDVYGRVVGSSNVATADLVALLTTVYMRLDGATMTGALTLSQDPTAPMHAVTKQYAETLARGLRDKPSMRLLSNINVTVANPGTATFDSVVASNGDRIFLANQTAQAENGPWVFNGAGVAMTRPTDFSANTDVVSGATYFIDQGTAFSDSNWSLISSGPYVLGTTALTFTQTSSLGQITPDIGLKKAGNILSLDLASRLSLAGGKLDLTTGVVAAGTGTKITANAYGQVTLIEQATPADIGAQPVSAELTAVAALSSTGIIVRTATGAYAPRTLVGPAAGIVVTNGSGIAGNPTIALADDLAAIEGLATFGFAVRTAASTWVTRTVAVAARLTISNPDGVAGNPTIDLGVSGIAAGRINGIDFDVYGRATGGTNITNLNTPGSTLLNEETGANVLGTPVYSSSATGVKKANGNAYGTSDCLGVMFADAASGAAGIVATSGEVVGTTAQWDAVTGQTGGLTFNATYFLDVTTAGKLTSTPPASGFLVPVGKAIGPTKLVVRVGQRIQL